MIMVNCRVSVSDRVFIDSNAQRHGGLRHRYWYFSFDIAHGGRGEIVIHCRKYHWSGNNPAYKRVRCVVNWKVGPRDSEMVGRLENLRQTKAY